MDSQKSSSSSDGHWKVIQGSVGRKERVKGVSDKACWKKWRWKKKEKRKIINTVRQPKKLDWKTEFYKVCKKCANYKKYA